MEQGGRSGRVITRGGGRGDVGRASDAGGSGTPPIIATDNVTGILKKHQLGRFDLKIGSLRHTSVARQLNPKNVANIRRSIDTHGFMENSNLSVIFIGYTGDKDSSLTPDEADKLVAVLLDGNHRVAAAREVLGSDTRVPCICYKDIADANIKRVVADACNDTASIFAPRTIFDSVFYYAALIKTIAEDPNRRSTKAVTAREMREPYKQAGISPPSESTCNHWRKVVDVMTPAGLKALKEVSESADPSVDLSILTLEFLKMEEFMKSKEWPDEQALVLQILARWNRFNANTPFSRKHHVPPIFMQAKRAASWMRDIDKSIISREEWPQQLLEAVTSIAYVKPALWALNESHFVNIKQELRLMEEGLPTHSPKLDDWIVQAVRSQQPSTIVSILKEEASTRARYEEYRKKFEGAKNAARKQKLQQEAPVSPPSRTKAGKRKRGQVGEDEGDDEEDEEEEEEEKEGAGGGKGKNKQKQNKGNGDEGDGDSDEEREKRRGAGAGASTDGSSTKSKKKQRQKATAMPADAESEIKEARMKEIVHVHSKLFTSDKVADSDLGISVKLNHPAKLMLLHLGADKSLLLNSPARSTRLKLILTACRTSGCLHPEGTIVLFVPPPTQSHASRFSEACAVPGVGLEVEESFLHVEYITRGGGRRKASHDKHIVGRVDHFIVAHAPNTVPGKPSSFTCNKNVTVDNITGDVSQLAAAAADQRCMNVLKGVQFETAKTAFPAALVSFAINRWTVRGDTVMSNVGDTDRVLELGLSLGRKVEIFPDDLDNIPSIKERALSKFNDAWNEGLFSRSLSGEDGLTQIKEGERPASVPANTTPVRVRGMYEEELKAAMDDDGVERARVPDLAALLVAMTIAHDLGYVLNKNDHDGFGALHAKDNEKYDVTANVIPIWGTIEIYNTIEAARRSIPKDDDSLVYVRLVRVADTSQLKQMLTTGKEFVQPGANLYVRVANTCPAYYARCDSSEGNTHHEVKNEVPRGKPVTGAVWKSHTGAVKTPVALNVYKSIKKQQPGAMVLVRRGLSVMLPMEEELLDSYSGGGD